MAGVTALGLEGAVAVVALVMAMTDALAHRQRLRSPEATTVSPSLTCTVYVVPATALKVADFAKPLSLPFASVVAVVGAKSEAPLRPKL